MLANFELSGKRALVTGGASGIGFGAVMAFLRCGATVAINDLPGSGKLQDVVKRLADDGHNVIAAPGDVGDSAACPAMVETAIDALGGLDYLVNNAGTPGTTRPIPESDFNSQDETFWNLILNVNLLGPYRCTKAAAQALSESHGAVVNTTSVSAFSGGGSSSPYCAAKAGLVNLTKEWARALAPDVRVNAIAPGLVDSDWMCYFPGAKEAAHETVPLQRIGTADDYGNAILFLAAGADFVTGQTLTVDGGMTS